MSAQECAAVICNHGGKWNGQRRSPPDQHIIMSEPKRIPGIQPDKLSQPPSHAVAFDGISDLLGDGETDPARTRVAPVARLQNKTCGRNPVLARGGHKIRSFPQALHRNGQQPRGRQVMRSGACGHGRAAPRSLCGLRRWPYGHESHDGACARACSVDRSVSRGLSPLVAARCRMVWVTHRHARLQAGPPTLKFRRLIRECACFRQCDSRYGQTRY